jgi:hypothetical protein
MARHNRKTSGQGGRAPGAPGGPESTQTNEQPEETGMQDVKGQEVIQQVNEATGKAIDALSLWAEANQRVLNQMVELGTGAAKESVKLYAELQQSTLDAVREGQAAALKWQSSWQEAPRDPMAWYQKTLTDSVDSAQKWFRLIESNAQAVTKSAERLQASAEQAGRGIQQTFTEVVNRAKDVYAANGRK